MAFVMEIPVVLAFSILVICAKLPLSFGADPAILVSVDDGVFSSGGIYFYDGDGSTVTNSSSRTFAGVGVVEITSMDTNVADGSVYFYDYTSRCIYRYRSGTTTTVHCGISSSYSTSLAYDWVSGNIYWADGFFNWIAVQPVDATDSHMYRVIIQDDIEKPRALAVDSKAGYVFWFDISTSGFRIERALLDGTSRVPIIFTSLVMVIDMEVDVANRRLYWTENGRDSIESSSYDGTDRKIVYREFGVHFRSIAVDTDHFCATFYDLRLWACFAKSTGSISVIRASEFILRYPGSITMYKDGLRPPMTDSCSTLGCEHFCVNVQPSGKCMCKEGYTLDTDGKQCTEIHTLYSKAIVVSDSTRICMLSVRALAGSSDPLRCVRNTVQGAQFLTVDTSNQVIYYVSTTTNDIREYDINTATTRHITTVQTVSGLAFDWIDRNLFWTESSTGKIKYISLTTLAATEFELVSSPPSDMTIDPHSRTLFWVEGTSGYEMKIVSMSLVSKVKSVILTPPSPATIKGIFFDVISNRLFFVESEKLSSIERNGSDINHFFTGIQAVQDLLIYKRYAIWSVTSSPMLYTNGLQHNYPVISNLTSRMGVITAMAVYDESLQRQSKGPCAHLNGGCEQLCLTGVTGNAVCACSYGLTLLSDGKRCGSVPLSSNFLLVSDINHGRLLQISTVNAQVTTLDINGVGRPIAAVVDLRASYVYWTDANEGSIKRSTLNDSHTEIIYTSPGVDSFVNSLAMDYSTGNLYFTVSGDATTTSPGSVGVLRPSTRLARTLVNNLNYINGLALYPSKGLMFFTHDDGNATFTRIVQASMDGTSTRDIIAIDPSDVLTNLAIDYTSDRLYWSSNRGGVESSSLSGAERTKLTTPTSRVESIDVDGGYLYLTSDRKHKVVKISLQSQLEATFMADNAELGVLHNIFVYPGQSQQVSSVCSTNNGGCSTFCLPKSSPSSSYCACQDGTSLKSNDPYTCQGVIRCPVAVPNGQIDSSCTHNAGEVCTFRCDQGYLRTISATTMTCGQTGNWDENVSQLCQSEDDGITPENQQTIIYVAAGLGGLVIISITIVAIVCVVIRKKRLSTNQDRQRSEPNVYYTPNHQMSQQQMTPPGAINHAMYSQASNEKMMCEPSLSVPTPPAYSAKAENVYDTIPTPPYEEPSRIQHAPSVRSQTSIVSAQSSDSDYLTLIRT
ncbi:low-density lipoprotein receptor-related protein 4-like [Argopecten irradians]|uniref:low-density lipoprotein receptor-related protein 4-like n=1 Tax=Argopecten irradians TaxID=31199 RepID=UPI00371A56C6